MTAPTQNTEICYFPIELVVTGANSVVSVTKALPLLYEKVEGVLVFHPGGKQGKGTMQLSIGGEEVFPKGFHIRGFMYSHSSHFEDEFINRELDKYMFSFVEKAKGATVAAEYTESEDGESGILYLIFKLTRNKPCR